MLATVDNLFDFGNRWAKIKKLRDFLPPNQPNELGLKLMKKAFFSLVIGIVLATSAHSQVVFLNNPPDMSNGAFLKDQYFNFDGSTIVWTSGASVVEAFSVQGTEDSGTTFLSFGQRGAAPYQVTLNQILFGDSVKSETLFVDGNDIVAETITDQYFGIKFDAGGGDFNYGWINLSSISAVDGGRINAVAFNTIPNADIVAGAVPEPKVALLLALAALAMITQRWRSNRSEVQS